MSPRTIASMLAAWIPLALAVVTSACSSDSSSTTKASLSAGCDINSDCDAPMVCAYHRCHNACESSRDCPADQRCMASDRPFHVCQLPVETTCDYNSSCPTSQVCGIDGQCRDECASDRDCVSGQVCTQGTCAEPSELDAGRLPVAAKDGATEASPSSGLPCVYNSDCPPAMLCSAGLCQYECNGDPDCKTGQVCLQHTCTVSFCGGADPGVQGGQACLYNSDCQAPLVCRSGICACACKADSDCPAGALCKAFQCVEPAPDAGVDAPADAPDAPDAPVPCSYNSDCVAPMVCEQGACRYECLGDVDCQHGWLCMGHVCTASFCGGADAGVQGGQPCSYDSQCAAPLVCRSGLCACACLADSDCAPGLSCQSFQCVAPDAGSDASLDAGTDASDATACAYNSDCPAPMLCRAGECRWECLAAADCAAGQVCLGHACTASFCGGADAGVPGGQLCAFDSQCAQPLVCRGGICSCECLTDVDCALGLACKAFACVPVVVDAGVEEAPPPTGTVEGWVLDATHYGKGVVPGATVSAPGGFATVTDADGHFQLTGLPPSQRTVLSVGRDPSYYYDASVAYANPWSTTQTVVTVRANQTTMAFPQLERGCRQTFDANPGSPGAVDTIGCDNQSNASYVRVDVEAYGLVYVADMSPFSGRVRADLFPVAAEQIPAQEGGFVPELSNWLAVPGDMAGVAVGGASVATESFGAAEVRLYDDATGAPLQVAPGHHATVTFSTWASLDGVAASGWWYDESVGQWREQATVTANPNDNFVQLAVSHLSWWSASREVPQRNCVRGVVRAGGSPLAGADVRAVGQDWGGASPVTAAADGSFCVDVKSGSGLTVSAFGFSAGRQSVDVREVAIDAAPASCGSKPSLCADVGFVDLVPTADVCLAGSLAQNNYAPGSTTPVAAPLSKPVGLHAGMAQRWGTTDTYLGRVTPAADGSFCAEVPAATSNITADQEGYIVVDDVAPLCHRPGRFAHLNAFGTGSGGQCGVNQASCEATAAATFDCTDGAFYLGEYVFSLP